MSRARTKHSRSGKSFLIQLPEGLPLSLSAHQAPAGASADVAAAYSQLFLPLSAAESFLSAPKPPNPGADLLEPCAEDLEVARKQLEQFLRQEETRLRAEAPGVFEVANEILDYTKALVVELPINRAWIEDAIRANSPPEQLQDRLRESRERLADKCRRHRGPDPVQTLVSLVDRLRTAISKWAADTKRLDPSWAGLKLPAGDQAEQTTPVTRAIALLLAADKEGKRIKKRDLPAIVGCSRSTLYRDPHFNAALKALKAQNRMNLPKGSKTKEGKMEAGYDPAEE